MKRIWAALAGTALIFGAAQAQNDSDHAQQRGNPQHDNPQGRPSNAARPGAPNPERGVPERGGPNRRDAPGTMANSLRMNRQGQFDHVGPNRPRRDFHGNFNADRRFHAGPWHPPRGYHYRRWTYGERLPLLYFSPGLWITSFGLYGLMAPPPDTVWVRSGPDALLVDRTSGEIIRVQYGVFY